MALPSLPVISASLWPTRVALPHLGQTTITLLASMKASFLHDAAGLALLAGFLMLGHDGDAFHDH